MQHGGARSCTGCATTSSPWPARTWTRRELFDFLVAELAAREHQDTRRIRPVRVALQNQRDHLLAFAGQLDAKLAER